MLWLIWGIIKTNEQDYITTKVTKPVAWACDMEAYGWKLHNI